MNDCALPAGFDPTRAKATLNRWIAHETARATREVTEAIEAYRFNDAANAIYRFVWNVYCDWYLELAKPVLMGEEGAAKAETRAMVAWARDEILKLLHPFMPFITEELWQKLPKPQGAPQSIMITLYPISDQRYLDDATEASMALGQKVVTVVRSLRTENNVPSSARPKVILNVTDDYKKTILDGYRSLVSEQARLGELVVRRSGDAPEGSVKTAMAGDVEVLLVAEVNAADTGAERAKLEKDRATLIKDREHVAKKLADPQFADKAPPAVIEKARARLAEIEAALAKIEAALARL
jgi:valyl-tRNA synthetase